MLTAIESVWEHIKCAAHDCAKGGRKLQASDAEALVVQFLHEAHVAPWPSDDIIAFYATELLDMAERDRLTVQ